MASNNKIRERQKGKTKVKNISGFRKYEASLSCGCCTDILLFKDDESVLCAMREAGLDSCATIVDQAGNTHNNVDTFYGLIKLTKKVLRDRRMEDK